MDLEQSLSLALSPPLKKSADYAGPQIMPNQSSAQLVKP
jgi:hypothetical protein